MLDGISLIDVLIVGAFLFVMFRGGITGTFEEFFRIILLCLAYVLAIFAYVYPALLFREFTNSDAVYSFVFLALFAASYFLLKVLDIVSEITFFLKFGLPNILLGMILSGIKFILVTTVVLTVIIPYTGDHIFLSTFNDSLIYGIMETKIMPKIPWLESVTVR